MTVSLTASEQLPATSRTRAQTVLWPSVEGTSVKGAGLAYAGQPALQAGTPVLEWQTLASPLPRSRAARFKLTAGSVAKSAPPLIDMPASVGLVESSR